MERRLRFKSKLLQNRKNFCKKMDLKISIDYKKLKNAFIFYEKKSVTHPVSTGKGRWCMFLEGEKYGV